MINQYSRLHHPAFLDMIGHSSQELAHREDSSNIRTSWSDTDGDEESKVSQSKLTPLVPSSVRNPCTTWGCCCGNGRVPPQELNNITLELSPHTIQLIDDEIEHLQKLKANAVKYENDRDSLKTTSNESYSVWCERRNKKWSEQEVQNLLDAYAQFGEDWKKISQVLGIKDIGRPREKFRSLFPKSKNNHYKWTIEFDQKLVKKRYENPNISWPAFKDMFFPQIDTHWLRNRYDKLNGLNKISKIEMRDEDLYKLVIMKQIELSEQDLWAHLGGRDIKCLNIALTPRLRSWFLKYRISYLEHLVNPNISVMKTPCEIDLSITALKWAEKVKKEELIQFMPLLKQELENKNNFTEKSVLESLGFPEWEIKNINSERNKIPTLAKINSNDRNKEMKNLFIKKRIDLELTLEKAKSHSNI